jgi:hypothetical protein
MIPWFSAPSLVPVTLSSEIADERLRRLVVYWYAKRGAHRVTRRVDIDPVSGRFHCRLAGESVREGYPFNIIGRYLDEIISPEDWEATRVTHREMVELPAIGHSRGRIYRPALGRTGHVERLILPMSDDSGKQVTMVFGASIYTIGPSAVGGLAGNDPPTPRLFPLD